MRVSHRLAHLENRPNRDASVTLYSLHSQLLRASRLLWPTLVRIKAQAIDNSDEEGSLHVSIVSPNRIRSMFEKAVNSQEVGDIVLIWRWFIRFELACGQPAEAKRVFLRAINRYDAVTLLRPPRLVVHKASQVSMGKRALA